jgi:hypothetical protein
VKRILAVTIIIALFLITLAWVRPSPVHGDIGIDTGTNAHRISAGLPALTTWAPLQVVADKRAREISTDFNHHIDLIFPLLPSCVTGAGENIAWSDFDSPDFVQIWWSSPEHRANMLGDWRYQASATYRSGDRTYAVQLFARGCEPAPASTPASTPNAPAAPAPTFTLPNTSTG